MFTEAPALKPPEVDVNLEALSKELESALTLEQGQPLDLGEADETDDI